jgi:hypothetical protein
MDIPNRILRTFNHQPKDHIVWQPSIMYWYNVNRITQLTPKTYTSEIQKFVPENYQGIEILELYKDIKGSIRYPHESLNLHSFYQQFKPNHKIFKEYKHSKDGRTTTIIKTPSGSVQEVHKNGFPIEYLVKDIKDLDVIEYILDQTEYLFNPYVFDMASELIQDLGIIQTYNFRSPYQRCVIEYLGFIKTTLFLKRYPQRMEKFIEKLMDWDEKSYQVIANSPLQIVSFGENIHAKIASPPIFERFHLPYYKKRVKQLHEKGKFCHIHLDGDLKDLIPFIPGLPFDGIEAITFAPQGDITIEELKDVIGNKILLDGIPSIYFLKNYSEEDLKEIAVKVLDTFSPNLILGISDELCPTMDGRRLKLIGDLVSNYQI